MDSQIVLIIILFFIFQFLCSSVVVDSKSITLSLSPHKHYSSSSSSSARAQSFKQSKLTTRDLPSAVDEHDIPLFPSGYCGYSLSLSFGTPTQTFPFVMDTGRSLTLLPCTSDFTCDHCKFMGQFIPKNSSSSKKVSCDSTQCKWLYPYRNCTTSLEKIYCRYYINYELGGTMGLLQSELLTFPDNETRLDNFIFGCSDYVYDAPTGIAGFGRGNESLPSQMELDSFSYCMASQDFDDNKTMTSDLVLTTKGAASNGSGGILQYTPFIDNPKSRPDYYYARLQNIKVGKVNITVPDEYQVPDVDGNGGTIVDSGTTFTVMDQTVFNSVIAEFERQVTAKNNSNSRNATAEFKNDLPVCFDVMSFDDIPTLSLHFQGGAVMDLPMQNYILDVDYKNAVCLLMTTQSADLEGFGPAIILGNYPQRNFYVEFDLKNNRLGFLKHTCSAK